MGLMNTLRFLLFCSFTVLSGIPGIDCGLYQNQPVKLNKTLLIEAKPLLTRKQLLLNVNGPPLVSRFKSDLEFVFNDKFCRKCTICMERAIQAARQYSYILRNRQKQYRIKHYLERPNDIDRNKRSTSDAFEKKIEQGRAFLATVKKYTKGKKVYAIEVQTSNEKGVADACHYYSVKKSLSCEEEERLPRNKRTSKQTNKVKKYTATTTKMPKTSVKTDYKKRRDVDNSQGPESYMLSLEDFY